MKVSRKLSRWRTPLFVGGAVVLGLMVVVLVLSRLGSSRLPEHALANLAAAKNLHTEAELTLHLPRLLRGAERPFTEVLARVSGDVHYTESGTPELAGVLYTEAKGRGNVFFADGDIRILEDEVRFRLDNLPVFLNRSGSLINRWTRVAVPLLETNNQAEISQALSQIFASLDRVGTEKIEGERLVHFSGQLSAEQEEALVELLRRGASGSPGWNVLSRLLRANNLDSFEVWIEPSDEEIRRVRLHFVRPLADGTGFDFALLTLTFSDYGKAVAVDRPEAPLVVQPRVFSKLFGGGSVEQIQ
jgi:hypothetical protein